ncbi:MAG: Fe-S cluster assembly ATPase SufC [Acidimicrobiia bacterium]
MTAALQVADLTGRIGDLEILKGVDLEVPFGEIHALMGPNGSGKSTLCHVLMGKPDYEASGSALVGGIEVMGLPVDERARAGLFEAFQYPVEIPGVTLDDLVSEMGVAAGRDQASFAGRVARASDRLGMERFRDRSINSGLSGGEKKRSEMYQLAIARPTVAVLDEIDSGLDIDAVREIAELVEALRSDELGVLIITHYSRILRYMAPDRVHVMINGRIVRSGGPEIAEELEASGYDALREQAGTDPTPGVDADPFAEFP